MENKPNKGSALTELAGKHLDDWFTMKSTFSLQDPEPCSLNQRYFFKGAPDFCSLFVFEVTVQRG